MWLILRGEVQLAPAGDSRNHSQWAVDEKWVAREDLNAFLEVAVRGYFLNNKLVAYKRSEQDDFSHFGVVDLLFPAIEQLQRVLFLTADTELYLGACYDRESGGMTGKILVGRLPQALERMSRRLGD